MLDSPQVIDAVEAAGGAVFREKCPGTYVQAWLNLFPYPQAPTHPAMWTVQYSNDTCDVDSLVAYYDAASGEFLADWSQIPEWTDSPPTAGLGTFTAMDGLGLTMRRAQAWQPSAALSKICADAVGRDGKAAAWSYTFLPARGTGEDASVKGLVVKLDGKGTLVTSYADVNTHISTPEWTQVYLDSPAALQIAGEAGGNNLLGQYPDTGISVCLEMESFDTTDSTKPILWNVHYADPAGKFRAVLNRGLYGARSADAQ